MLPDLFLCLGHLVRGELFAAFHASSWPDPVPLFAFGLVAGWLAWRTQSVVASIVFHAMFNATALVLLRLAPMWTA